MHDNLKTTKFLLSCMVLVAVWGVLMFAVGMLARMSWWFLKGGFTVVDFWK